MENIQKLVQIYNSLMQMRVEGENVLILGGCLAMFGEVITKMQNEIQTENTKKEGMDA